MGINIGNAQIVYALQSETYQEITCGKNNNRFIKEKIIDKHNLTIVFLCYFLVTKHKKNVR